MKRIIPSFLALCMFACGTATKDVKDAGNGSDANNEAVASEAKYMSFGELIDPTGTITADEFVTKMKMMETDSLNVKVKGSIDAVCQRKGCWMDVGAGAENADNFSVRFKDYGFFVPKDAMGKETIFEGVAFLDTISVEELKHYAEDAGLSQDSIDLITEEEINIGFTAKGVLIEEYAMETGDDSNKDSQ